MASQSENLKVIFFESASENKSGKVIADGYFSFVPTFKEGDTINMTLARREATNATVHNPIGHKTHRVDKTDWVLMVDERSKNALATLVVSVSKIDLIDKVAETPDIVATHG
ncbi:hypothetical protein GO755_28940 [Spirosoma sp. HMF4905]|uniref:Uncharacterized protein n=1 Tax=Spirosoma arboris TaxID=2682092 RepID=A0A7K1SJY7_9BACT|nr:hypothetical protein [Spirosoma arboris]MVM34095.1 hypothetical protein [Spirosoma arboris]